MNGSGPQYYPSYDEHDPIPQESRGMYYNGKSYSILFPHDHSAEAVNIGPDHTWQTWINIADNTHEGAVFRQTGEERLGLFVYQDKLVFEADKLQFESDPVTTEAQWFYVATMVTHIAESENTEISFNVNEHKIGMTWQTQTVLRMDSPVVEFQTIGAKIKDKEHGPILGFRGFIWQVTLSNRIVSREDEQSYIWVNYHVHKDTWTHQPASSERCLGKCPFNSYEPHCLPCEPTCAHGCSSAQSCSLCKSLDWQTCTSFDYDSWIECRAGKLVVEGICQNFGPSTETTYIEVEDDREQTEWEACASNKGCVAIFIISLILVITTGTSFIYLLWFFLKDKQSGLDKGQPIPVQDPDSPQIREAPDEEGPKFKEIPQSEN